LASTVVIITAVSKATSTGTWHFRAQADLLDEVFTPSLLVYSVSWAVGLGQKPVCLRCLLPFPHDALQNSRRYAQHDNRHGRCRKVSYKGFEQRMLGAGGSGGRRLWCVRCAFRRIHRHMSHTTPYHADTAAVRIGELVLGRKVDQKGAIVNASTRPSRVSY